MHPQQQHLYQGVPRYIDLASKTFTTKSAISLKILNVTVVIDPIAAVPRWYLKNDLKKLFTLLKVEDKIYCKPESYLPRFGQ